MVKRNSVVSAFAQTTKSELATMERVVERLRGELTESERGWDLLRTLEEKCVQLESDLVSERHEKESLKNSTEIFRQEVGI